MKVASPAALARLLHARLEAEGDPGRAITLAEALERVVPYHVARGALRLGGKPEYDLAVLGLLRREDLLDVDPHIRSAVARELESPEPSLGFADELGEGELRLRGVPPEAAEEETSVEPEPEGAGPTRADGVGAAATPGGRIAGEEATEAGDEGAEEGTARSHAAEGDAARDDPAGRGAAETAASGRARDRGPSHRIIEEPGPWVPLAPAACWNCRERLPERDVVRFCAACGVSLEDRRCAGCGERIEPEWRFCARCGRELGSA